MSDTLEQVVVLGSKSGLHARPAAIFVQKAKEFRSAVTLSKGGKTANARSILSVLSLGGEQGDSVLLKVSGEDAWTAMDALVNLLEKDLG